jgi:hypothetical protein
MICVGVRLEAMCDVMLQFGECDGFDMYERGATMR